MSVQAVIFDLDNTLYDYDAAHEIAFGALCDFAQREFRISAEAFRALHKDAMTEQQRRARNACAAIHNRVIRYQLILERVGKPIFYAPRMSDIYWTAFLDACRPISGVREALEALKADYVLGVGTNMTADYQFRKLERLGLLTLFDFMVSSEEVNAEKPDAALFDLCAEKAGCPAAQCAFVGDNYAHDVAGARAAGMRPVWLSADAQTDDCPVIRRVADLPELLRRM